MNKLYEIQKYSLKKLDYKGFTASLSGILLAILLLYFITQPCMMRHASHLTLVEVKNYQYEPVGELLMIEIPLKGGVWFDERIIADDSLSKLGLLIEDEFVMRDQEDTKILLKADQAVPYGKIVQIFQVLRGVGIKTVGLITEGHANPLIDYMTKEEIPKWAGEH